MNFRENLRFLMESRGIQTKELSSMTGISENTIKSYIKEDAAEPKISKALIIAKSLNVPIEYLVTGIVQSETSSKNMKEINHLFQKILGLSKKEQKVVLALVNELIQQFH